MDHASSSYLMCMAFEATKSDEVPSQARHCIARASEEEGNYLNYQWRSQDD